MNRDVLLKIVENRRIATKTWMMKLKGDTRYITNPGQFVNLLIKGKYLRRPISVGDYISDENGELILFYDVVGEGTAMIAEMHPGKNIQSLMGLGNGFDTEKDCLRPALIGGGIGTAPLLALAKKLLNNGKKPVAFLGFNTCNDIVLEKDLNEIGIETIISTADGSKGTKGYVTDACKNYEKNNPGILDYFYACGPTPMLKAVCQEIKLPGELSLDERMGCGFGACMCCSVKTKDGAKRICKDGPVFKKEELIWE